MSTLNSRSSYLKYSLFTALGLWVAFLLAPTSPRAEGTALCRPLSEVVPPRPTLSREPEPGEIVLNADRARLEQDGQTARFAGNVLLQRDNQILRADSALYHRDADHLEASGEVTLWDPRLIVRARRADLLGREEGRATDTHYWLLGRRGRGEAGGVHRLNPNQVELKDMSYTTCDPEAEFWRLTASKSHLDFDENVGTARHVTVRLREFPIFYTPYIHFPIGDERKSGFLFPQVGNSNTRGFEFSQPYYWNIAPNYDATLTPHLMTKRGMMLKSEFRYLFSHSEGKINLEYLPDDRSFDDSRSLTYLEHSTRFGSRIRANLLYQEASDDHYFEDMGSDISLSSLTHLQRRASLTYRLGRLTNRLFANRLFLAQANVLDYQTLSANPAAKPYARMPQLIFRTAGRERNRRLNYDLNTEYVYFEKNLENAATTPPTGSRVDVGLELSYPLRYAPGFWVPKGHVRHTHYALQDQPENKAEDIHRSLAGFSQDAGLFFERDTAWGETPLLHTLEPRLFYVYVPYRNQEDIPIFDTSPYDFSFGQLFREERFTGADRVGDENRLTVGATTRLLDRLEAREYLRLSLGQIRYFSDRRVTLPGQPEEEEESSDLIAEVASEFVRDWSFRHTLQWDPSGSGGRKSTSRLRYRPGAGKLLNLSYRYRRSLLEQTDLAWQWPLTRHWGTVGRWNYSLRYNTHLESFLGLEYNSCCWAIRVVGRRYLRNLAGDYQNGIYLQLELKGLTGVGRKTSDFLSQRIPEFEDELLP